MFKRSLIGLSIMSVVACGGGGAGTTPTPVPAPAPAPNPVPNIAPKVSVSGKNAIEENESLALSAIATDDDGTIDTVLWSIKSGPIVSLIGADTIDVSFIAPNVNVDTVLVLAVQVTDSDGATATSDFSLTITPAAPAPAPNIAPEVNVTGPDSIQEFEIATLNAVASDADGIVDTVMWSIKSGPIVTLTGANSNDVSFTAPDVETDTNLVLEVQVTDNDGATATSEFSLTITPTVIPRIGDSVLSFLSGTKTGLAVFNDDRVYLSIAGSAGISSYAKFANVHESNINGVVTDAPGIGYNLANYFERVGGEDSEIASLNTVLVADQDNIVTSVEGFDVALTSGTFSTSLELLPVNLLSDLTNLNGQWKDVIYSDLTIDSGLNLSATDEDGCVIDGVVTPTSSGVFAADLNYSGCSKAGTYSGIMTLKMADDVSEIEWMAFDDFDRGVFANVDTEITQDEALSLTGELLPSLYASSSKILMAKSGQLFTFEYISAGNASNPFVFQYNYDENQQLILGNGEGLPDNKKALNSTISIPVTPALESVDVTVEYENGNNSLVTKQYSALDYIPSDVLLDSITGQWGRLVFSESGVVSGIASGCLVDGQISNKQSKIWDLAITFSGCSNSGDYTGVIVGAKGSAVGNQNDVIVTSFFNDTKTLVGFGIISK